ncbi:hypothetical protein [Acidianus sp. HS-5]|uniref:hypothetical protein n=1 Tax=Acidianus sp. HS-5 TaxID=2886040 RepID=UPI001F34D9B3|nr:hypothetical protein [Acidianus sp. HS-5]
MRIFYLLIILAISIATNATPFFGTPYTLVATTLLLKCGITPINLAEAIIITGVGAAVAKSVMYFIGLGARKGLKRNRNVIFFSRFTGKKSFYITLFLASIFPFLPLDDLVYLIGGTTKTSLISMLKISLFAKIIKSSVEIPIEAFGILQISEAIGISPFETGIISTVIMTVLAIILFKIDWENTYRKIEKYLTNNKYFRLS